jgi:hypothetical protein
MCTMAAISVARPCLAPLPRIDEHHALLEAQVMSASIRAIAMQVIDNAFDLPPRAFPLLEAIIACAARIDAAVDPVIDPEDTQFAVQRGGVQ